jgi:prophage maintenance system killer protein
VIAIVCFEWRELTAEEVDAADVIRSVAAGKLTEQQLATWISEHARNT